MYWVGTALSMMLTLPICQSASCIVLHAQTTKVPVEVGIGCRELHLLREGFMYTTQIGIALCYQKKYETQQMIVEKLIFRSKARRARKEKEVQELILIVFYTGRRTVDRGESSGLVDRAHPYICSTI